MCTTQGAEAACCTACHRAAGGSVRGGPHDAQNHDPQSIWLPDARGPGGALLCCAELQALCQAPLHLAAEGYLPSTAACICAERHVAIGLCLSMCGIGKGMPNSTWAPQMADSEFTALV